MDNLLSQNELEIQFQIGEFVLKTQRQIEKDFFASGAGFKKNFTEKEWTYDAIFDAVLVELEKIMRAGETQLLQLLYQIDISQKVFLNLIGQDDLSVQLTSLIIRREAFKVFLRSKF